MSTVAHPTEDDLALLEEAVSLHKRLVAADLRAEQARTKLQAILDDAIDEAVAAERVRLRAALTLIQPVLGIDVTYLPHQAVLALLADPEP